MAEQVEIVQMPSFFAAIIKVKTNPEAVGDDHEKCFPQVLAYLHKNNVQPAGPPLSFYLQWENDSAWEIGAGFPVETQLEGDGTIEVIEVPAGTVATLLHVGPYDELEKTWNDFEVWHKAQGHKLDMESYWCWESFLTDPDQSQDESQPRAKLYWML